MDAYTFQVAAVNANGMGIPEGSYPQRKHVMEQIQIPWLTADDWQVQGANITISANLGDVIETHGPGVYTIVVWGAVEEEGLPLTNYSIFVE